eukprot:1256516-Rhodomonas_salina.4
MRARLANVDKTTIPTTANDINENLKAGPGALMAATCRQVGVTRTQCRGGGVLSLRGRWVDLVSDVARQGHARRRFWSSLVALQRSPHHFEEHWDAVQRRAAVGVA